MSANRWQLDLGLDRETEGWMRQVHDRLARRRDLAYSLAELSEAALGSAPPEARAKRFQEVLNALVWIGAADTHLIGSVAYYALAQEFDTATWQPRR